MAVNPPAAYGRTLRCHSDADSLFSSVEGVDGVEQDAFHVLTTDDFLGPGGDDRGENILKYIGLPQSELTRRQPSLVSVLLADERVLTADVTLTSTVRLGLADVILTVACKTSLGPFEFTKSVLSLTEEDIEAEGNE